MLLLGAVLIIALIVVLSVALSDGSLGNPIAAFFDFVTPRKNGIDIESLQALCALLLVICVALIVATVIYNHMHKTQKQIIDDYNKLEELRKKYYDWN